MKTQTVKTIFANLLFSFGIILMVIGFIRGTLTIVNSTIFDKYPLNNYEETKCDSGQPIRAVPIEKESLEKLSLTEEQKEENKQSCITSLEHTRKVKQVEDITYSISFLISGLALALVFNKFKSR